ncbi:MAG: ShlB/FhaC/HecB family hemolysin secretion/activation protein [Alphaproteobacteria bacterium]|nr:ShlB/FhaC/HecB family hemolysin secretion/activation protein [Alphaproteobacteria bacterium]
MWARFAFVSSAWAQNVPATVDPARVIDRFDREILSDEEDVVVPQGTAEFSTSYPEGAEGYSFLLEALNITGVNVYDPAVLLPLYDEHLGQEISVADLFAIADKITKFYRDDGYILAQAIVPPQEIDGEQVEIHVTEGHVAQVKLEGGNVSSSLIKRMTEKIKHAPAFNVNLLERQLLLLNRMTGVRAVGVIEPVSEPDLALPGAVALKIIFTQRDNDYLVSLDNYGSKFVGPWQFGASVEIPHTTLFNGLTNMAAYTTPQFKELGFVSFSETVPLTADGLALKGGIKYSRSEPGNNLEDLELKSRYFSVNLGLEYPLYLRRSKQLDLFGRFEYNNSKSDILNTRFFDDRLRVLRTGLKGFDSNILEGQISGEAIFSQGLDILGARGPGSIDLSRAQGRSDFSKVNASMTYLKGFGKSFGFKTSLMTQYAFSPLLSSEEFGYGGYEVGRAYNSSEITGDSGIAFLTELSYQGWAHYSGAGLEPGIVPFLFYDAGRVWNRDDNTDPESGASMGAGFDLNWGGDANLRFTVAQPLSRRVQNPAYGNGKNPVYLISLKKQF